MSHNVPSLPSSLLPETEPCQSVSQLFVGVPKGMPGISQTVTACGFSPALFSIILLLQEHQTFHWSCHPAFNHLFFLWGTTQWSFPNSSTWVDFVSPIFIDLRSDQLEDWSYFLYRDWFKNGQEAESETKIIWRFCKARWEKANILFTVLKFLATILPLHKAWSLTPLWEENTPLQKKKNNYIIWTTGIII